MRNRIFKLTATRYPILHVEFGDGFSGEYDVSGDIESMPMFAPLRDQDLFSRVRFEDSGYRLGWRLDEIGNEIDYSSESIRNFIETGEVKKLAAAHRARLQAAE